MKINKLSIALVVLMSYFLVNFANLIQQELRLQNYNTQLDSDFRQVKLEKKALEDAISHYKTKAGVEELARKKLGYYNNHEVPLRVIPESPEAPGSDIQEAPPQDKNFTQSETIH